MQLAIDKYGVSKLADDATGASTSANVVRELFTDHEEHSSISSEREVDADDNIDPPDDYLPKGWMVFQLLGPFSQPVIQMNFFSDSYTEGSRKAFHDEQKKAKGKKRDHSFDFDSISETTTMNSRGIGAVNRKYLERNAQHNTLLSTQQYKAEVMKITNVLKSKSGQCDPNMALHAMYLKAGQTEKGESVLEQIANDMNEINKLVEQLLALKNLANTNVQDGGNHNTPARAAAILLP